ncbi:hypothetical protein MYX82_01625 [Acidobacteria bacterium AH-259-D05]|nr:hypothetical protein [Acidobacteria bacterium AH-259-D05]
MSWTFYLGLVVFFTFVFAVFSAVAYSVILGIRDNYLRYYQKAELQWTEPGGKRTPRINLWWLIAIAFATAWLVVEFVINPHP